MPEPRRLIDVRREVMAKLAEAGLDDPGREASVLIGRALGQAAGIGLLPPGRTLTGEEQSRLATMLARRAAHEPLSRIVGEREFYGRTFEVTPATLDPRPDTETVVDAVLALLGEWKTREGPLRILDIGTGTGCLLVTLLAEFPKASGLATDISGKALAVARANAARHGVASRASFLEARSLNGVEGQFDLVVSNPPYISSGDIAGLERAVREYDPRLALDGGADGLAVYRELAEDLTRVLTSGWIVLECGAGQAAGVAGILAKSAGPAAQQVRFFNDLGGHTRCVAMRTHF